MAAAVWTCVGTLAILERLDLVDADTLCWWLCERQLPNGGLNGRPEKLEDVSFRTVPAKLARADLVRRFATVGGLSRRCRFSDELIGSTGRSSPSLFFLLKCVTGFPERSASED